MTAQMTSEADPAGSTGTPFDFVTTLADELSKGNVDLPSFPDVAMRVRRLLADKEANVGDLVRIVGSEPALALRLLKLANSASLNQTGKSITELRTAIARIGFNMVRSASLSFAMSQMQRDKALKAVEEPLRELWRQSTYVAALAYVIAKRHDARNADEAFLAGLVHGVGRLYLVTKLPQFPALNQDPPLVASIMRDWHTSVAKAILENWEMSGPLIEAVETQDQLDYVHPGPPNLSDLVIAATFLTSYVDQPQNLELNVNGVRSLQALGLDVEACTQLLAESQTEVEALRTAIAA